MIDPAISPDGTRVCFSYLDDLWDVSINGGIAKRLTSTVGYNNNPEYSPDGKYIAFNSNRDGLQKVYIIPADGGLAKEVSSESLTLHDWFNDSKHILGTMSSPGENSFFVKLNINDNKRPIAISDYADAFASISSDDKTIVFNKRGDPYREAYSGSHNGDLFLYNIENKNFKQLTHTSLTERYPVFSKKNKDIIYYCASDSKVFQIFKTNINDLSKAEQLTNFDLWSPRDLSISDNDIIVFEFFNKIWKYDANTKKAEEIKITIAEDFLNSSINEEINSNTATTFASSPNGKLIVFSYKYDLFAVPTAGGKVKQITYNQAGIEEIIIGHDNETIFFTSYLKGDLKLYKTNIYKLDKIDLVKWSEDKIVKSLSTFNKNIYIRYDKDENRNRIAVMDSSLTSIKDFIPNHHVNSYTVSNDSKYAFFTVYDRKSKASDLYFMDVANKTPRLIHSQLAYISSLALDMHNKALFLTFNSAIHRLDLVTNNEFSNDVDKWDEILKEKRVKIEVKNKEGFNWDNLENRFNTVVNSKNGMWVYPLYTTNDSILYYMSYNRDKNTIRKVKYNGKDDSEVFDANASIGKYEFINDNKGLIYSVKDNLYSCMFPNKKGEMISFKHNYKYDTLKLNKSIFEQVWASMGNGFYDRNMHNQDWQALYNRYSPYTDNLLRVNMLGNVIDEMIGDLNASHTGFYPRREGQTTNKNTAYLGINFDMSKRLKNGIMVSKVYKNSALGDVWGISSGDILLEIDGQEIDEKTSVTDLLVNKVGEILTLKFMKGKTQTLVEVKALSYSEQNNLRYDNWVAERIEMVKKASNGELGYLHIRRMDKQSLEKFKEDLFSKNYYTKGLIIDVRKNGGGNISEDLIDILSKRHNSFTQSRLSDEEPIQFPSSTYEKPLVLLIDEDSFSDAEVFPNIFKYLKMGTIIGMPTSGSVIGTSSTSFMDGSSMRMPRNGWYVIDKDGLKNMEGNPAEPDIVVPHTIKDIIEDNDKQLERAIQELKKMIQ